MVITLCVCGFHVSSTLPSRTGQQACLMIFGYVQRQDIAGVDIHLSALAVPWKVGLPGYASRTSDQV